MPLTAAKTCSKATGFIVRPVPAAQVETARQVLPAIALRGPVRESFAGLI